MTHWNRDRAISVTVIVVGGIVAFVSPYLLPVSDTGDKFPVALSRALLMGAALFITWWVASRVFRGDSRK